MARRMEWGCTCWMCGQKTTKPTTKTSYPKRRWRLKNSRTKSEDISRWLRRISWLNFPTFFFFPHFWEKNWLSSFFSLKNSADDLHNWYQWLYFYFDKDILLCINDFTIFFDKLFSSSKNRSYQLPLVWFWSME